jgi:hypothetical protein
MGFLERGCVQMATCSTDKARLAGRRPQGLEPSLLSQCLHYREVPSRQRRQATLRLEAITRTAAVEGKPARGVAECTAP